MNMRKTITFLFIMTSLFAIGVLIWYFFIREPSNNPTFNNPTNPFGTSTPSFLGFDFIQNNNNDNQNTQTEIIPGQEKLLQKIWNKPTAGFTFVDQAIMVSSTSTKMVKGTSTEVIIQKKASSTKMFFVDRMTGYVYGYGLDSKKVYQITNSTMPGIYDAYFFNNGSSVIMRYLGENNSIKSIIANIPLVSENSSPMSLLDKTSLPNDISAVSTSYSSKEVSYFIPKLLGGTIYSIKAGNKITTTKQTPHSEITIKYGGESLYFTTKPSAYITGFTVDTQNNERVMGDKTGLITLPANNDEDFLANMWTSSGLATFMFSKKTNDNRILNIKTIADKCAWDKNSIYALCGVPKSLPSSKNGLPDDWYQGLNQFSDTLYIVKNKSSTEYEVFNFSNETHEDIDLIKPKINSMENYLGFINKRDGNLWLVHTKNLVN